MSFIDGLDALSLGDAPVMARKIHQVQLCTILITECRQANVLFVAFKLACGESLAICRNMQYTKLIRHSFLSVHYS